VCNALRNDLNHSNEYVRGCMLRFLCKLREAEIIEPLVPSIKVCLEHRHSYVRKNAALAIYHIHKLHGHTLIPDGAEVIDAFLKNESEVGSRRNAFMMLINEAEDLSIEFLAARSEELDRFGDGFDLLVLELTRKVCRRNPSQKARFVHFIFQLLASPSAAVSYEAAWTLVSLSSSPTAVRAAATTYTSLLYSQSDNNVKLIVLERLAEMKVRNARVLMDVIMDLLRALASPNIDICKRTLEIALDLMSPRNVEEVVQVLKREVTRTRDSDLEKGCEYRTVLIQALHSCTLKFPSVAGSVIGLLMEFLGVDGAKDVILFVRAIMHQYGDLRDSVLKKLLASFTDIKQPSVLRVALWIIGEFSDTEVKLQVAFDEVLAAIGMPPYVPDITQLDGSADGASDPIEPQQLVARTLVLADGTYASQSTSSDLSMSSSIMLGTGLSTLRRSICDGDAFLATSSAAALTKLAMKSQVGLGETTALTKWRKLKTLQVICGVAKMIYSMAAQDNSHISALQADERSGLGCMTLGSASDCLERLSMFTALLLDTSAWATQEPFLLDGQAALSHHLEQAMTAMRKSDVTESYKEADHESMVQPDELIIWRQLRSPLTSSNEFDMCDGEDLMRATGTFAGPLSDNMRRSHVYQLSGFADPVYAEAHVTVHDYDILLDVLVVNRTVATLTNLTVELYTMGDLKLVERPQSLTIAPLVSRSISANIKVSSTETGHIFGTIVYDNSSSAEKTYINLNSIHLDIMDYIRPASCSDESFRSMWAEFEWENKVAIATHVTDLSDFLEHIVSETNMNCLTPRASLSGGSSFLAANLYAKSIFDEDALVNVSVEKKDDADGKLSGYIRIRSKTQGIALSLGDRITAVQRNSASLKQSH